MKWIYKSLLHYFTDGNRVQWGMKETIIAVLEKMEEEGTESETQGMGGLESVWNKNKSAPFCPLHGLWNYPNYTQKLPVFLSRVHTCTCACAHTRKEEREHLRRSIAKSPTLWWKSWWLILTNATYRLMSFTLKEFSHLLWHSHSSLNGADPGC